MKRRWRQLIRCSSWVVQKTLRSWWFEKIDLEVIIRKLDRSDVILKKQFIRRCSSFEFRKVCDLTCCCCCLDRTHFNLIPPAQRLTSRYFFLQNFNEMQFQKMEVGNGISESDLGFTTTSHPTSALQWVVFTSKLNFWKITN